eukprot:snap_masked-scaffold_5-processed-gene-13.62-mRNA-1 protein AED:1.00 eAED:1.00 QI:0/0/0/0/1/1/3/0/84
MGKIANITLLNGEKGIAYLIFFFKIGNRNIFGSNTKLLKVLIKNYCIKIITNLTSLHDIAAIFSILKLYGPEKKLTWLLHSKYR